MRRSIALVAALVSLAGVVRAGDWRNGKSSRMGQRDPATLSYNYVPTPTLQRHQLPRSFNWCDKDGLDLCTPSWNQHIPQYCGSCWAHGTLAAIQDRLKIKKKGRGMDVMLARQVLLNCGAFHNMGAGCDGGDVIDAFHYMTQFGLPDESCQLYNATDHTKYKGQGLKECPQIGKCMNCMPINGTDTCWPVDKPIMYKLKSYGRMQNTSNPELAMMSEIAKNGPITCSIATPDEFVYNYRGGVTLASDYKKSEVDHDIEVVGWGTDHDGTPYWQIRNSWGTFWGELGFFKLERGTNALQIEEGDCWVADPDYEVEEEVREGKFQGSMYGLVDNPEYSAPAKLLQQARGAAQKLLVRVRKIRPFLVLA